MSESSHGRWQARRPGLPRVHAGTRVTRAASLPACNCTWRSSRPPCRGQDGGGHEGGTGAARGPRDAKTRAKAKWSGSGRGHVDALQRIDRVDGFEVSLTRTGEGDSTDGFEVS